MLNRKSNVIFLLKQLISMSERIHEQRETNRYYLMLSDHKPKLWYCILKEYGVIIQEIESSFYRKAK